MIASRIRTFSKAFAQDAQFTQNIGNTTGSILVFCAKMTSLIVTIAIVLRYSHLPKEWIAMFDAIDQIHLHVKNFGILLISWVFRMTFCFL